MILGEASHLARSRMSRRSRPTQELLERARRAPHVWGHLPVGAAAVEPLPARVQREEICSWVFGETHGGFREREINDQEIRAPPCPCAPLLRRPFLRTTVVL